MIFARKSLAGLGNKKEKQEKDNSIWLFFNNQLINKHGASHTFASGV